MRLQERFVAKINSRMNSSGTKTALDPERVSQIRGESLLFYSGNIHSQRGQDGILSEIFRRIGISKGRFVEFGAWNGVYLSNSRYLFERGWTGAFIEASRPRFIELCEIYKNSKTICINALVGAEGFGISGESLSSILRKHNFSDQGIDFLSIDVDGPDLEIFESLDFFPSVILLEGGSMFSPFLKGSIDRQLAWNSTHQPISFIVETVKRIGYVPVCFCQDIYLVRKDLAVVFEELDAITLYTEDYNFLTFGQREDLHEAREKNKVVVKTELDAFGHFDPNPFGYDCEVP